jgi:hypothetical protein
MISDAAVETNVFKGTLEKMVPLPTDIFLSLHGRKALDRKRLGIS